MSETPSLSTLAISEVDKAVTGLIGWTNIHLSIKRVTKTRLRRASAQLRALETLLRRLIMYLALQMELEPRTDSPPTGKAGASETDNTPIQTPEGIEIAHFPRVRTPHLSLTPGYEDGRAAPDFSELSHRVTPTRILAKRFAQRIIAIRKVIDAPEAHAKRLAHRLRTMRAAREPAPILLPQIVPRGMSTEVAVIHGALKVELRAALKKWDTS
ncbi:MAG: hypothetical protein AAF996_17235, partial [Pseudomonadota bacterium]